MLLQNTHSQTLIIMNIKYVHLWKINNHSSPLQASEQCFIKKKGFYWIHKIPSESFISHSCLPQASEQYFKKQSYFTHSCLPWASEQYLKKHSCFTQYALLWIFTFFYDFFQLFSTSLPIPRPILSNDVKIIFSNFSSFFLEFFSNQSP